MEEKIEISKIDEFKKTLRELETSKKIMFDTRHRDMPESSDDHETEVERHDRIMANPLAWTRHR